MRLKVLLTPFFVVMILIIGIGYIKPDIEAVQMKRSDVALKKDMVTKMETIRANTLSLTGSLDAAQQSEKFAYRYLPETLSQDQVIDIFNFLAAQSGLTVIAMDLKQPPAAISEESVLPSSAAPLVTGVDTASGTGAQVPTEPEKVKTFMLVGSVQGSYENIKAFFNRLVSMERFHEVRVFSISADVQAALPDGTVDVNRLKGTFEASIGYLPAKSVVSAYGIPVFAQPKFDLSALTLWMERIGGSVVPPLEKGQTGKANPFQ